MKLKKVFVSLFSIKAIVLLSVLLKAIFPLIVLAVNNSDLMLFHAPDTRSYLVAATELFNSGKFTSGGQPELFRTPGYPLFLIPGLMMGNVELVTIFLQIILSCLTVYFIYKISSILFNNERIALLSALLYTIDPSSIFYASTILTETLFNFLMTLFIFYLLSYLKSQQLRYLTIAAILLAASTYVRPISLYLPWLTVVSLLILIIKNKINYKKLAVHLALFIFIPVSLTGLWQWRNQTVAGYQKFSAISDVNLYFYQGASVLAAKEGVPFFAMQEKLGWNQPENYFATHPEQLNFTPAQIYDYQGKQGKEIVLNNLGIYSRIHLVGIVKILLNPDTLRVGFARAFNLSTKDPRSQAIEADIGRFVNALIYFIQQEPLFFIVCLIFQILLIFELAFALIALCSKEYLLTSGSFFILSMVSYFLIISGGPDNTSRYRFPLMPLICVLAGYGLFLVLQRTGAKAKISKAV